LIATTVAACRAVSISPFYLQQVGSIKIYSGRGLYVYPQRRRDTGRRGGCRGGLRVL